MNVEASVLEWSVVSAVDDNCLLSVQAEEVILVVFACNDGWEWQIHVSQRLVDRGGASTMTRAQAMAERFNKDRG